jgi:hypothetical protein
MSTVRIVVLVCAISLIIAAIPEGDMCDVQTITEVATGLEQLHGAAAEALGQDPETGSFPDDDSTPSYDDLLRVVMEVNESLGADAWKLRRACEGR